MTVITSETAFAPKFTEAVAAEVQQFLQAQKHSYAEVSEEVDQFIEQLIAFFPGGKFFRPLCVGIGAACIWGNFAPATQSGLVKLAAAVELVQAAALIHDDVIDNSPTRRGRPSVHEHYQNQHRSENFSGSASTYGNALAIVLGDLALSLSDKLAAAAYLDFPLSTRRDFDSLKTEVMLGQFLDIANQHHALASQSDPEISATLVTRWKTVPYTTQRPLLMGLNYAMAKSEFDQHETSGVHPQLQENINEFAIELGYAFQLRDDLLGIFADEVHTGKSAISDLVEGKRTVLVAKALKEADPLQIKKLQAVLGNTDANEAQIAEAKTILEATGAKYAVEALVQRHAKRAQLLLDQRLSSQAHPASLPLLQELIFKAAAL